MKWAAAWFQECLSYWSAKQAANEEDYRVYPSEGGGGGGAMGFM